ncbi:MAG TPA: PAS domain S-box protein [Candidatus Acidoferrales bacterium]|nr:PAS domain S-box protein [Candidatus Acidoferrales bacterium]
MPGPHILFSDHQPHRWMRFGSVLISFAAVILLAAAVSARFSSDSLSWALLTVALIALALSIGLHARFLLLARREHCETAGALDAAEREYKSVFDNALDGILILDNHGMCLEANPAALALLGISRRELGERSLGQFFAGDGGFQRAWKRFLDRTYEHSETPVSRGDGRRIFVEYTAKADFLPGRHVAVFRDISQRKQAEAALRESEERFQQMAGNIQEIFWMLDAENMKALYVNPAYETITGRSCQSLSEDPKSYQEVIHPEDRLRVLSRLDESVETGQFDEEFRIVRPDDAIHWVWVRGFPVRDSVGIVRRLVGTAQDITVRKSAEVQMARNLDMAEAAREEAEAFRKTSLALTQNLSMDYVLDTLLRSLLKLVPCESAQAILVEVDTRLFLAREVQNGRPNRRLPRSPATWDARDSRFFMEILATKKGLLITNTVQEEQWVKFKGFSHLRSWLCVPLVASEQVLGFLSLGDTRPQTFTEEHLRLAKSLAIPAAVAIQNARLYERAEIYGTELGNRLAELETAQRALRLSEEGRTLSEERFTKVFRSSPIPFSVTTLDEGRFVEVNDAFESCYGYSREQLIGRTVSEVGIWDDLSERRRIVGEIREHGHVRGRITLWRRRSGEVVDAIVSAEAVELDGRECLLIVAEDSRNLPKLQLLSGSKSAAAH